MARQEVLKQALRIGGWFFLFSKLYFPSEQKGKEEMIEGRWLNKDSKSVEWERRMICFLPLSLLKENCMDGMITPFFSPSLGDTSLWNICTTVRPSWLCRPFLVFLFAVGALLNLFFLHPIDLEFSHPRLLAYNSPLNAFHNFFKGKAFCLTLSQVRVIHIVANSNELLSLIADTHNEGSNAEKLFPRDEFKVRRGCFDMEGQGTRLLDWFDLELL